MDAIQETTKTATGQDKLKHEVIAAMADELRKRDEQIAELRAALTSPETLLFLFNTMLNDEKLGKAFVRNVLPKIEKWKTTLLYETRMQAIEDYTREMEAVAASSPSPLSKPIIKPISRFFHGDEEITEREYRDAEDSFIKKFNLKIE